MPTPSSAVRAAEREAFRRDVLDGLRRPHKELPCKYFYDEKDPSSVLAGMDEAVKKLK